MALGSLAAEAVTSQDVLLRGQLSLRDVVVASKVCFACRQVLQAPRVDLCAGTFHA